MVEYTKTFGLGFLAKAGKAIGTGLKTATSTTGKFGKSIWNGSKNIKSNWNSSSIGKGINSITKESKYLGGIAKDVVKEVKSGYNGAKFINQLNTSRKDIFRKNNK